MVMGVLHVLDVDVIIDFVAADFGLFDVVRDNSVLFTLLIDVLFLDRRLTVVLRVLARGGSRLCGYHRRSRVAGGSGDWGSDSSRSRGCRLPVG